METRPNARGRKGWLAPLSTGFAGSRQLFRRSVAQAEKSGLNFIPGPMLSAPTSKVVQASLTLSQPCRKRPFGMWAHSHEELLREKSVFSI
jgi:hypothetical protein